MGTKRCYRLSIQLNSAYCMGPAITFQCWLIVVGAWSSIRWKFAFWVEWFYWMEFFSLIQLNHHRNDGQTDITTRFRMFERFIYLLNCSDCRLARFYYLNWLRLSQIQTPAYSNSRQSKLPQTQTLSTCKLSKILVLRDMLSEEKVLDLWLGKVKAEKATKCVQSQFYTSI